MSLLIYEVQPEFADPRPTDYIAAVGERVKLNCSVRRDVYPFASVVWSKQKGNLHVGETYTIERAAVEDSGTYICTATNNPGKPFGSRSKSVVLYVYGKRIRFIACMEDPM